MQLTLVIVNSPIPQNGCFRESSLPPLVRCRPRCLKADIRQLLLLAQYRKFIVKALTTAHAALLSFNMLLEMSALGRELPVSPKT